MNIAEMKFELDEVVSFFEVINVEDGGDVD